MISGTRSSSLGLPRATLALAGAVLLLLTLAAGAQTAKPAPPAREVAPVSQPGMLESVGRWFRNSFGYVGSNVEGARDAVSGMGERAGSATRNAANAATGAAKDAANAATGAAKNAASAASGAAKDAAGAVARLPGSRVVKGHERCVVAPNGAPDCQQAAEAVCRTRGFTGGASVDIQSAKECPMEALLSRGEKKSSCPVNSYVTSAVCQ